MAHIMLLTRLNLSLVLLMIPNTTFISENLSTKSLIEKNSDKKIPGAQLQEMIEIGNMEVMPMNPLNQYWIQKGIIELQLNS